MESGQVSKKGPLLLVTGTSDSGTIADLEKAGFDVVLCQDPTKAVTIADIKPSNWQPTIIVVDVILPQMSGYEVVRRLNEKWALKKIPILMIAQHPSPEDMLELQSVGAIALLQKPLTWSALADVIEKERMKRLKAEIGDLVFKIGYE